MQSTINQRVKFLIESECMSINAFSKKIGVLQKTLNEQIKGNNGISLNTILCILDKYPNISAEWLMRGVGTMEIEIRGYGDDKGTSIHIDASGDHVQGDHNITHSTVGESSEELIELRVENKMLKEQVEDLRKDKDNLIKLLTK